MKLTRFQAAALETLVWSETDADGRSLDEDYNADDIARDEAFAYFLRECNNFETWSESLTRDGRGIAHVAQDFILTRNRHGAGFWDGGWKNGRALTDAAHTYGTVSLMPGGDGKLYIGG